MSDKKYLWPLVCYGSNLYFNTIPTIFYSGLKVVEHFKPEVSKLDFSKIVKGIGTIGYGLPVITNFVNFTHHQNLESFLLSVVNGLMTFELGSSFFKNYDKGDFKRWKDSCIHAVENIKSKGSKLEEKL